MSPPGAFLDLPGLPPKHTRSSRSSSGEYNSRFFGRSPRAPHGRPREPNRNPQVLQNAIGVIKNDVLFLVSASFCVPANVFFCMPRFSHNWAPFDFDDPYSILSHFCPCKLPKAPPRNLQGPPRDLQGRPREPHRNPQVLQNAIGVIKNDTLFLVSASFSVPAHLFFVCPVSLTIGLPSILMTPIAF